MIQNEADPAAIKVAKGFTRKQSQSSTPSRRRETETRYQADPQNNSANLGSA